MEDNRTYKQQFIAWLNSLPEEDQENFARIFLAGALSGAQAPPQPPEKQARKSRYSDTVLNANQRPHGRTLAEYLLESEDYFPDDADFSRTNGPPHHVDIDLD